jgi:hypothetical protein
VFHHRLLSLAKERAIPEVEPVTTAALTLKEIVPPSLCNARSCEVVMQKLAEEQLEPNVIWMQSIARRTIRSATRQTVQFDGEDFKPAKERYRLDILTS